MRLTIRKTVLWLLIPAILMGPWAAPVAGAAGNSTVAQSGSVVEASARMVQVEATPVTTEPAEPAPASSDPASTSPTKESGTTTVAPADFPNVCDGSYPPTQQDVTFTVSIPPGYDSPALGVLIFAENGGCIRGYEYQVPVNFPERDDSPYSQTVQLPAGRYVYQYSGDGFEPAWGIPFQVTETGQNSVIVEPKALPPLVNVTAQVTLPDNGSPLTIVITDASGTVDSATVIESGPVHFNLPAGDYFYQYWGDDYPWSGEIKFTVSAEQENVFDIAPQLPKITLDPTFVSSTNLTTNVDVGVQGFRAFDEYELNFNNGQVVQYGTASDRGEIFTSFSVAPGLVPGEYPVVVTGAVTGQRIEATFTVLGEGQLVIDPTSGPAGSTMSVTGSRFAPGETVNIRLGSNTGLLRGVVTANKTGEISGRISIPPSTTEGTYPIVATGETSKQSATVNFTVTGRPVTVNVSPKDVTPGTIVTVTGSGFRSGAVVDIYWGSASGPLLGYRTADSSGSFTGRVTVPRTAVAGDHLIFATNGNSGPTAAATVSVTTPTPQVTVTPTSQTSGKVVSVSGSGFGANEVVDIRWNGASGKLLGYRTTDGAGTFSGKVTVPAGTAPGNYSVVMIGRTSKLSATAPLTVTGATVKVTPAQASPGTVVAVSGSGFGAGEIVDIRWNGPSGKLLGYRTTSSSGSMSGRVTIPTDAAPGTYTLHLQGQTSGIVGSVTVTVPAAASAGDREVVWRLPYSGDVMIMTNSTRPTL